MWSLAEDVDHHHRDEDKGSLQHLLPGGAGHLFHAHHGDDDACVEEDERQAGQDVAGQGVDQEAVLGEGGHGCGVEEAGHQDWQQEVAGLPKAEGVAEGMADAQVTLEGDGQGHPAPTGLQEQEDVEKTCQQGGAGGVVTQAARDNGQDASRDQVEVVKYGKEAEESMEATLLDKAYVQKVAGDSKHADSGDEDAGNVLHVLNPASVEAGDGGFDTRPGQDESCHGNHCPHTEAPDGCQSVLQSAGHPQLNIHSQQCKSSGKRACESGLIGSGKATAQEKYKDTSVLENDE